MAVWSPSGCRLMCSLRQAARAAAMTPRTAQSLLSPFTAAPPPGEQPLPLEVGQRSQTAGREMLRTARQMLTCWRPRCQPLMLERAAPLRNKQPTQ